MTIYSRDGREVMTLHIRTKVPEKWVAVDRETGDAWEWRDGGWRRSEHAVSDSNSVVVVR